MDLLDSRREADVLHLTLRGAWSAASVTAIRTASHPLAFTGIRRVRVTIATDTFDRAGAWALDALTSELAGKEIEVEFAGGEPPSLQLVRYALHADAPDRPEALRASVYDN